MENNFKKPISEMEITMHNLRCAAMIGEEMNKKQSVFLFAVSMDQKNELNVVSGAPDNVVISILEQLLKGMKQGLKLNQF